MFMLGFICIALVALLISSLPKGPPPREPDGSITMTTMYEYERHNWKAPWIVGLGLAASVFLGVGCWRWYRQRKDKNPERIGA